MSGLEEDRVKKEDEWYSQTRKFERKANAFKARALQEIVAHR